VTLESILFYIFATVGILSAITVVTRRNPIISAIFLILNFFCLAGLYLTLHAQFIAIIQILVYAGAIMVLFVFVIMLLNLHDDTKLRGALTWKKVLAGGVVAGLLMELVYIFFVMKPAGVQAPLERSVEVGTVEYIGSQLFTRFLFPFEVTSILLTAAIVGALVLAKKTLD
jgi:NADH-quinone oxidoreductase subunit J